MRKGPDAISRCLFLMVLTIGLLINTGLYAAGTSSGSGCIACHTDEETLVRNLSPEKPKGSSMTSGAG